MTSSQKRSQVPYRWGWLPTALGEMVVWKAAAWLMWFQKLGVQLPELKHKTATNLAECDVKPRQMFMSISISSQKEEMTDQNKQPSQRTQNNRSMHLEPCQGPPMRLKVPMLARPSFRLLLAEVVSEGPHSYHVPTRTPGSSSEKGWLPLKQTWDQATS